MATSLMFTKLVVTHGISVHKSAVLRTSLQQMKSWSGRKIMCIIVKIMRIIVLEHCRRLLSILYTHLPAVAVERASFIDTNQSFLGVWVKNCCLHVPIFRVQKVARNPVIIENNRKNNDK